METAFSHSCALRRSSDPLRRVAKASGRAGRGVLRRSWYNAILVDGESRAARRHFRSTEGIIHERRRQLDYDSFVIHPYSKFRSNWCRLLYSAMYLKMITTPLYLTYIVRPGFLKSFLKSLAIIHFVILGTDIIMCFFTGRIRRGERTIILDRHEIAMRYIRTDLVRDVLFALPWSLFAMATEPKPYHEVAPLHDMQLPSVGEMYLRDALALASVTLFVRLPDVLRYYADLETLRSRDIIKKELAKVALVLPVVINYGACLTISTVGVVQGRQKENIAMNSWVKTSMHESIFGLYLVGMMRFLQELAMFDDGRTYKGTVEDQLLETAVRLFAVGLTVWIMARLMCIDRCRDSRPVRLIEISQSVKQLSRHRRLPQRSQRRLREYYAFRLSAGVEDDCRMYRQLSVALQREVALTASRAALEALPALRGLPLDVIERLVDTLSVTYVLPGDIIYQEGVNSEEDALLLIVSGAAEALDAHGAPAPVRGGGGAAEAGGAGGTMAVDAAGPLAWGARRLHAVARTACEVRVLRDSELQRVMAPYPRLYATVLARAAAL